MTDAVRKALELMHVGQLQEVVDTFGGLDSEMVEAARQILMERAIEDAARRKAEEPQRGDARVSCGKFAASFRMEVFDGTGWVEVSRILGFSLSLSPDGYEANVKIRMAKVGFTIPGHAVAAEWQRPMGRVPADAENQP